MTRPAATFGPAALLLLCHAALLPAQRAGHSSADSLLVRRILTAEQRGDASDRALAEGAAHSDAGIRTIAVRARQRIEDSTFGARSTLPAIPAPPVWPEAAWKSRYRALPARGASCEAVMTALADRAWQVRFRATEVVPAACAAHPGLVALLQSWIDSAPRDGTVRAEGDVTWHGAARALAALARFGAPGVRERVRTALGHPEWHLRFHAVRAARLVSDTAALRRGARDADPNVREAAIEGLAAVTGREDDSLFIAALGSDDLQPALAAARALRGTADQAARNAASAAFERWAQRGNASERDVRLALLEAAGRPASDDRPPAMRSDVPDEAVALALGSEVRLRVTMVDGGGKSFVVRMRGDVAPITAARILELVDAGYYDGLSWHRVEHDFVIQGGSPGDNEYVGSTPYYRDELGTVSHRRGTVGMSTRGHDTGDAQWFINLRDNQRLDGAYTVFAEVVSGIEVVDEVLEGDRIATVRRETGR